MDAAEDFIDPEDVELEPDFVRDPPRLTSMQVELLDEAVAGDNVRLTVRVADDDRERVGRAFAFLDDSEEGAPQRRVFRDDGGGVDRIADDGIFSTAADVTTDALVELNGRLQRLQELQPNPLTFEERAVSGETSAGNPVTLDTVDARNDIESLIIDDWHASRTPPNTSLAQRPWMLPERSGGT